MMPSSFTYLAADIPPAKVGDLIDAVDTPAALLDLLAAEDNIIRACTLVREAAVNAGVPVPSIRPHFKAHKCTQLALLQISLSNGFTTGMCCQKVCEAEACFAAGITDIYVCNQIVAPSKISRLVSLAMRGASVGVAVDCESNVRALNEAACAVGAKIRILIEIEVGSARCGVASPEAAVALAKIVESLPALTFGGIHAYNGVVQHARQAESRAEAAKNVAQSALLVRIALEAEGIECRIITGGGTGTFLEDAKLGVLNELQPGSYVLSDADYSRNLGPDGEEQINEWAPALTLLARVCSRRDGVEGKRWIVCDAGLKAQSTESGLPILLGTVKEYVNACEKAAAAAVASSSTCYRPLAHLSSLLTTKSVSDEHLTLSPPHLSMTLPEDIQVGTGLVLQFSHCDPAVNHFDFIVAHSKGIVVGVYRSTSRSPGV